MKQGKMGNAEKGSIVRKWANCNFAMAEKNCEPHMSASALVWLLVTSDVFYVMLISHRVPSFIWKNG